MSSVPLYTPPASANIKSRQNDTDALRLLVAQRRLHSKAKVWQGVLWFGLLAIGVAAPLVSVIWPSLAVVSGAIAGAWLFLGRTLLQRLQTRQTDRAAAAQEEFDFLVFNMPRTVSRSNAPRVDELAKLAGPDAEIDAVAKSERLVDWYPVDGANAGVVSVAIAQCANAAYSNRLLRTTVTLWVVVSVVWGAVLAVLSLTADLKLSTFLAGVLLPVLPATLDVFEYIVALHRAGQDRGSLARTIEGRLSDQGTPIEPAELLVWQERMYELRRSTPQVPNWLYKLTRASNEAAMHSAANELGRRAGGKP